jgi:mono/diheme cytochrome c family protein
VRLLTIPLAILAGGLVIGCGSGSGSTGSAEEVARGQELFKATCASCHGPNAEGMPKLGKNLHENVFVRGLSEPELVEFFKQGRPASHPDNERKVDMPPRGGNPTLTDEDLRLIAVYVKSIE